VLLVLSLSLAVVTWLYRENVDALAANLRLADEYRLERHRADAAALWPALPELVPALERWLAATRDLPEVLAFHEERLRRERDEPRDDAGSWIRAHRTELCAKLRAFLHDPATDGGVPDVERRLAAARAIASRTVDRHRDAWSQALARIGARPDCRGFDGPVVGLVPLGPDPQSRLEEFAHVPSGDMPEREPDTGLLRLRAESGIVFVLCPAASSWSARGAALSAPEGRTSTRWPSPTRPRPTVRCRGSSSRRSSWRSTS
jgi:hypothetical protein